MREMWNFYIQRLIGNIRAGASSSWRAVNSERLTELSNSGIAGLSTGITSFIAIDMLGLSSKQQLVAGLFGIIVVMSLMTQLRYNQTNSLQIQELQELEELQKLWLQIDRGTQRKVSLPQATNRSFVSFVIEQKPSLLVSDQNSENDQRYRAAGFDPATVPEELKCPMSGQIFTYPVKPRDSEVEAIEISTLCHWLCHWLDQNRTRNPDQQPTHPLTGTVLNMKDLKVDMELAKKAEDFVENKITRIKNLLIYSSRLFAKLERKKRCSIIAAGYAVIVLGHYQSSSKNLVISSASLNPWIPQIPDSRKKIAETVFAYCAVNFFGKSPDIAAENLNPQTCSY